LAWGLKRGNASSREYAGAGIRHLVQRDWDLLPVDLVNRMVQSLHCIMIASARSSATVTGFKAQCPNPNADTQVFSFPLFSWVVTPVFGASTPF